MRTIDQVSDWEREKLEKRAKAIGRGATAQDVLSADEMSMDATRYVLMKGRRSIDDLREVDRMLAVEEQGREDALRDAARERASAEMRSQTNMS